MPKPRRKTLQREIHYLGHCAFEIVTEAGTRFLIDPYITGNPACPYQLGEITQPDLILVSHAAQDHLGDTLELARGSSCTVVCDPAVRRYLVKNQVPEDRIKIGVWGYSIQFHDIHIRIVESHHLSVMFTEAEVFPGLPLGFIISTEAEGPIYHPGDTSIFSDARLIGELHRPKVGMLAVESEMTPREAALMASWLGLKVAIPIHYRNPEPPKEFTRCLKALAPAITPLTMTPGQRVNL